MRISRSHPRFESLRIRELLVAGLRDGIVVPEGLLAHGRGEAFDYLLGEKTGKPALKSIEASAALLLTARNPVLSVNGNTAVLVPREVARLAAIIPAKVEVNLFHRTLERERRIAGLLKRNGVREVMGIGSSASLKLARVSSRRKMMDPSGIGLADVVLVPLEDGDRATALEQTGKKVIAVDLNPLSRTAQVASITIVDNVVRAFPRLVAEAGRLKTRNVSSLRKIVSSFDNGKNLSLVLAEIGKYLQKWRSKD
jgi:4-phosphopantoate--beta-alanine ligase